MALDGMETNDLLCMASDKSGLLRYKNKRDISYFVNL